MSALVPVPGPAPGPGVPPRVASVPYDVVNTDEARALAAGKPLSFLHVTRSEIDLPPATQSLRRRRCTRRPSRNFADAEARRRRWCRGREPSLYLYRLRMGRTSRRGWPAASRSTSTTRGLIKKHEKTRKDKEDDRTRHIIELRAQTGVVFLTYRAAAGDRRGRRARVRGRAALRLHGAGRRRAHDLARDGRRSRRARARRSRRLPALYIADGHHRAASAARARRRWRGRADARPMPIGSSPWRFPTTQVQILPYNRVGEGPGRPDARVVP